MEEKVVFQAPDATGLDGRVWKPEGGIRGVVQLVHGMAEHIDRYRALAEALNTQGWAVVGHNHRGHGDKAELRGYFADRDGWEILIRDVQAVREQAERLFPGKPVFILGHSMGSFVVRCYLTDYSEGLKGAVLSGTGFYPAALCRAGRMIARAECLRGKSRKESPLVNKIGFEANNKPFAPNRTPFDWLSRDEKTVDRYVRDPLCGFLFTGRGYLDLFSGLLRMSRPEEIRKIRKDLPILFLSGEKDPVGQMGQGVRKVAELFRKSGIRNISVRLYPEARHEVFNEINREEVIRDLCQWLSEHN